MKNSNTIVSGILTVAVIILFVLHFSGKGKSNSACETACVSDSAGFHLPIAYIRTDSLLNNYKFYKDVNDAIMSEYEDHTVQLRQRQQKLQKDAEEFQRKAKMNAYLTQERMNQEYARLQQQDEELNKYAANLQTQLASKQAIFNQQLQDTILSQLKVFNTPKKYEMIFSNIGSDNFFYIGESYDITQEVIDFLNSRYVPAKQ